MKWAQLIDYNGKIVWINSSQVTCIKYYDEKSCMVHFSGAADNRVHVKLPVDEAANAIR